MPNIIIQHCELSTDCPAICDSLKEVHVKDGEGTFFLQLCDSEESCPFKKPVNHIIDADILN
jgi:hypothetical protein